MDVEGLWPEGSQEIRRPSGDEKTKKDEVKVQDPEAKTKVNGVAIWHGQE